MEQEASPTLPLPRLLPHDAFNRDSHATILLIHGALGSRDNWDMVVPFLNEYHVLVPDLPGHGRSKDFAPFSLDRSADLLAKLVKDKGIGGVACVVGHSLGASVALRLAATYPEVVQSMVVSGYGRLPKNWFSPYLPYAIWTEQKIENLIPRPIIHWLMDGSDIRRSGESSSDVALIRQCFADDGWPQPWPARTLVIAATKRGIIPSDDNANVAGKVGEIGQEMNSDTQVVEHPDMRHPWNRQAPELFADTVKAWMRRESFPIGFRKLRDETNRRHAQNASPRSDADA